MDSQQMEGSVCHITLEFQNVPNGNSLSAPAVQVTSLPSTYQIQNIWDRFKHNFKIQHMQILLCLTYLLCWKKKVLSALNPGCMVFHLLKVFLQTDVDYSSASKVAKASLPFFTLTRQDNAFFYVIRVYQDFLSNIELSERHVDTILTQKCLCYEYSNVLPMNGALFGFSICVQIPIL